MRRDKVYVEYDESARKDYLTGFRKRKNERRKEAQDKIEREKLDQQKEARGL